MGSTQAAVKFSALQGVALAHGGHGRVERGCFGQPFVHVDEFRSDAEVGEFLSLRRQILPSLPT